MDVSTITELLNLGWPAIVTIAFILLARQYVMGVNDEIAYLRQRIDSLEAKLVAFAAHDHPA